MEVDFWFDEHWADKITDEFSEWWAGYYGLPDEYETDLEEYFIRMAFAFQGWSECFSRLTNTV